MTNHFKTFESPLERLVTLIAVSHAKMLSKQGGARKRFPDKPADTLEDAENVEFSLKTINDPPSP